MMGVDILSNIIIFLDIDDILSLFITNKNYYKIKNNCLLWQQLIKRDYHIYDLKTYNINTYKNVYQFENQLIVHDTIRWSWDAMSLMYQLYDNTFFNQYVLILNQHVKNYITSYQIVKILYKAFTNGKTLDVLNKYCGGAYYRHYYQFVNDVTLVDSEKDVTFYKNQMHDNIHYCYRNDKIKHGTTYKNYFLMVDLYMEILEQHLHYNNIYQIKLLETIDKIISYAQN